jgi:hydrogenase nickel incorporation protein HypB
VTEGEDKPLKYPTIFNTADVAVLTKMDLAAAVEFDAAAARRSIQSVRPGMEVFEVSAKTGEGLERWLQFLQSRRAATLQDSVRRPAVGGSTDGLVAGSWTGGDAGPTV